MNSADNNFIDSINSINNYIHSNFSVDEKKYAIINKAITTIAKIPFENLDKIQKEELRVTLRGLIDRNEKEEVNAKKLSIISLHSINKQVEPLLRKLEQTASLVQSQSAMIFDKKGEGIQEIQPPQSAEDEKVVLLNNVIDAKKQNEKETKQINAVKRIQKVFRHHHKKRVVAATTMQKAIRKRLMKKKLKKIDPEKVIQQKELAQKYKIQINPRVREPLTDLQKNDEWVSVNDLDQAQAQKAITKATKVGSYNKFVQCLKLAFSDTLQSIYQSPQNEQAYVILADLPDKSTNWVISHLHDMMSVHPPSNIISRKELRSYLETHPHVKHIVMLDDASYSGVQVFEYISRLSFPDTSYQLHVTIPYMTTAAKKRISESLKRLKNKTYIHNVELMLSYDQLIKERKIFSYTGKVKIDSRLIQEITELSYDEKSSVRLEINRKLQNLKDMNQAGGNEQDQYEKILEIIFLADGDLKELKWEGTQLMQSLLKAMHLEEDKEQEERLIRSYIDETRDYKSGYEMRTPSWFAHKGADYVSTNDEEMLQIIGNNNPIEPYKNEERIKMQRMDQIYTLKTEMPDRTLEESVLNRNEYSWLKDRVDFVETNRGCFLLGNSYIEETFEPHLRLHIHGKVINLGGEEGEYQYKLKEGDVFKLEDPLDEKTITLKLQGGKGQARLTVVSEDNF